MNPGPMEMAHNITADDKHDQAVKELEEALGAEGNFTDRNEAETLLKEWQSKQ